MGLNHFPGAQDDSLLFDVHESELDLLAHKWSELPEGAEPTPESSLSKSMQAEVEALTVAPSAIKSPMKHRAPRIVAVVGLDWVTHPLFAGSALMKSQPIEGFARPQDLAALRGVMSRLVTRFPENGEILDLINVEYRAGRPLPAIEKAVAARIATGEALPHTLAKARRDHLRKMRGALLRR